MISKEALLQALAKQLHAAQTGDEQATREALIAIRALCDVALSEKQMTMPMSSVQPMSVAPRTHIEDDGANGNSIFDF